MLHYLLHSDSDIPVMATTRLTAADLQALEREKMRCAAILENTINKFRNHILTNRILFENSFVQYDKRRLGVCSEDDFWMILRLYRFENLIDSDEERDLLVAKFKSDINVRSLNKTGTRTMKGMVKYRTFTETVMPKRLRLVEDAVYKFEPSPEVSLVARDLDDTVRRIKKRNEKMEIAARKSAVLGLKHASSSDSVFNTKRNYGIDDGQITDPFVSAEISKIISSFEGDKKNRVVDLTRAQLLDVFKKIMKFNRIPTNGITHCADLIYSRNGIESTERISIAIVKSAIGVFVNKKAADGMVSKYNVSWRELNREEALKLDGQTSQDSQTALDKLLNLSSNETLEHAKEVMGKTLKKAIETTRVSGFKPKEEVRIERKSIYETINNAPARSDVVCIPNVYLNEVKSSSVSAGFDLNTWRDQFGKLGLKNETLELAVTRKSRSLTAPKPIKEVTAIPEMMDVERVRVDVLRATGSYIVS